jgi:hypothetical protein
MLIVLDGLVLDRSPQLRHLCSRLRELLRRVMFAVLCRYIRRCGPHCCMHVVSARVHLWLAWGSEHVELQCVRSRLLRNSVLHYNLVLRLLRLHRRPVFCGRGFILLDLQFWVLLYGSR